MNEFDPIDAGFSSPRLQSRPTDVAPLKPTTASEAAAATSTNAMIASLRRRRALERRRWRLRPGMSSPRERRRGPLGGGGLTGGSVPGAGARSRSLSSLSICSTDSASEAQVRRVTVAASVQPGHEHGGARVARCFVAQQVDHRIKISVERHLQGHLGELLPTDDGGVANGIRGQLLVRNHEPGVVTSLDERVGEPDLLDGALDVVDGDQIAEPQRLGEGDHDPGDEVRERALGGEADDEARRSRKRRGARRPPPAPGNGEQGREDPDDDDRRHQAAAQHLVSGDGPGRELAARHAPVDELREHDRERRRCRRRPASAARAPCALYSTEGRSILRAAASRTGAESAQGRAHFGR